MKIIVFKGGLGNQMFQYVFYNYLKKNNYKRIYGYYGRNELAAHNGLELARVFKHIHLPSSNIYSQFLVLVYKICRKLTGKNKELIHDEFVPSKTIFDGYWHNEHFLDQNTPNLFDFMSPYGEANEEILNQMKNKNSISIHIRRGDYLSNAGIYGNICDEEYYKKAIDFFGGDNSENLFVFFSDDIEWVKIQFGLRNAIYIDHNKNEKSYLDMYLMSQCSHNIIANSTFSWWGAYLNKNKNKIVIMPAKWYNTEVNSFNLYIDDWHKF